MSSKHSFFRENLLGWYSPTARPLPWKGIKNPYFIWLSEIILQQTRVEQGTPYYLKFIRQYPTAIDLAMADEDEVLKLWQGLGYYSRARYLHASAKIIAEQYQGIFPSTYPEILALKGVGEYTAAAISSFAYGLPYAVVDGNVYRVLSRFFGIETPIDSTAGKKLFKLLAQKLLNKKQAANYNQAIMDFGATLCLPQNPICTTCPLVKKCTAFKNKTVQLLPIKTKKIKYKKRYFYYLIINTPTGVYLKQRTSNDIWKHLYDFPLIEKEKPYSDKEIEAQICNSKEWRILFDNKAIFIKNISKKYKQTLSHQKITFFFIEVFYKGEQAAIFDKEKDNFILLERKKIQTFAVPKTIANYLNDFESKKVLNKGSSSTLIKKLKSI